MRLKKLQAQAKNFCRVLDIRVAQIVKAGIREADGGGNALEVVVNRAFLQVSADGIRENKAVGVVPYFRSGKTELVLLYLLML